MKSIFAFAGIFVGPKRPFGSPVSKSEPGPAHGPGFRFSCPRLLCSRTAGAIVFSAVATALVFLALPMTAASGATITGPRVIDEDATGTWSTDLKPPALLIDVQDIMYNWLFGGPGGGKYSGETMTTCSHSWDTPLEPKKNHVKVKVTYTHLIPAGIDPPTFVRVKGSTSQTVEVLVRDITAPGQDATTGISGLPPTMSMKAGRASSDDLIIRVKDNNPTYAKNLLAKWKVELYYQIGNHDYYHGPSGPIHCLGPFPCNYPYSDIKGSNSLYYATEPVAPDDPYYHPSDPNPDPGVKIVGHVEANSAFPGTDMAYVGPMSFEEPRRISGSGPKNLVIEWRIPGSRILAPLKHATTATYWKPLKFFVLAQDHCGNCVTANFDAAAKAVGGNWTGEIEVIDDCPPWVGVEVSIARPAPHEDFERFFSLFNKTRERFCNFDDHWDSSDEYLLDPYSGSGSPNTFVLDLDMSVAEDTRIIFHPIASDNVDQDPLDKLMSRQTTGYASGTDPAAAEFTLVNEVTGDSVLCENGKTDFLAAVIFREPGSYLATWKAADKAGLSRSMSLKVNIVDTRMKVETLQKR